MAKNESVVKDLSSRFGVNPTAPASPASTRKELFAGQHIQAGSPLRLPRSPPPVAPKSPDGTYDATAYEKENSPNTTSASVISSLVGELTSPSSSRSSPRRSLFGALSGSGSPSKYGSLRGTASTAGASSSPLRRSSKSSPRREPRVLGSPSSIHKHKGSHHHQHQHHAATAAAAAAAVAAAAAAATATVPPPLARPNSKLSGPSILRHNRGTPAQAMPPPPPLMAPPPVLPLPPQALDAPEPLTTPKSNSKPDLPPLPQAPLVPPARLSASSLSIPEIQRARTSSGSVSATPPPPLLSASGSTVTSDFAVKRGAVGVLAAPKPATSRVPALNLSLGADAAALPMAPLPPATPTRPPSAGNASAPLCGPPPLPPRDGSVTPRMIAVGPAANANAMAVDGATTTIVTPRAMQQATPRPSSTYRPSLDDGTRPPALAAVTRAGAPTPVQTFRRRTDSVSHDMNLMAQGSPALSDASAAAAAAASSSSSAASGIIRKLQLLMGFNKSGLSSSSGTPAANSDQTAAASALLQETLAEVAEQNARLQQLRAAAVASTSASLAPQQQAVTPRKRSRTTGDEQMSEELESIIIVDMLAQLYLTSAIFFRSPAIAYALLTYDTTLVVAHLLKGLAPTKQPLVRRQSADVLSSLALVAKNPLPPSVLGGQQSLPHAAANFLAALSEERCILTLITTISDADWVVKSNIFGVLGCLTVDPVRYVPSAHLVDVPASSASFSYSFDAIPRVVSLLSSKTVEIREAALNALAALGPAAASAVPEVVEVILRDRMPHLRLRAVHVLNDIGLQACTQVAVELQEAAKKDKDDAVRKACAKLIEDLVAFSSSSAAAAAADLAPTANAATGHTTTAAASLAGAAASSTAASSSSTAPTITSVSNTGSNSASSTSSNAPTPLIRKMSVTSRTVRNPSIESTHQSISIANTSAHTRALSCHTDPQGHLRRGHDPRGNLGPQDQRGVDEGYLGLHSNQLPGHHGRLRQVEAQRQDHCSQDGRQGSAAEASCHLHAVVMRE